MAALSLSSNVFPFNTSATLSGTINTMQELEVPARARRVEIVFTTNAGVIVTQGGTDATVITTEKTFPIPADSAWFYDIPRAKGDHSIWVASGTASTVCSVLVTEGD